MKKIPKKPYIKFWYSSNGTFRVFHQYLKNHYLFLLNITYINIFIIFIHYIFDTIPYTESKIHYNGALFK